MLSRIRQYVDSEGKIGEYIFSPRHFKADFQRVRTISKGFSKCFLIPKGFKAFQSSRNCSKYSKKQIGFGHGNLYNLHWLYKLFVCKNLAFYTKQNFLFHIDTTLMVEAGKFGDIPTSKTWLLAQGTQAGRYATKISLLRSLVASQQLLFSRMSWARLISDDKQQMQTDSRLRATLARKQTAEPFVYGHTNMWYRHLIYQFGVI